MKGITALRRLPLLRVAAALVIITTGLGWSLFSSPLAAKASTADDILFVHGIAGGTSKGSLQTVPGGCPAHAGTWNNAESYFRNNFGWTGGFKTVGYYRGDWQNGNHCDIQFDSRAPGTNHESACDGYFYDPKVDPQDEGTNNQDLRNIACQLAWYIFQNYTAQNKNVWIVAHSMGGLIVRWAIWMVEVHDPHFPLYLYVPGVVTFATPHGGIPNPAGAGIECDGCTMASNMQTNAGPPSSFINTLLTETYAPMGSPGEPTEWTLMTSTAENWTEGVAPDSALNFPNSRPGYPAVHKIEYTNVPDQQDNPYLHGDFLNDGYSDHNATANTCDNCSFPSSSTTVYHSLYLAFQNLSHSVPAAPTHAVIDVPNGGGFFDDWQAVGGVHRPLGDPTSDFYSVGNGQEQDFQGAASTGRLQQTPIPFTARSTPSMPLP